MNIQGQIAVSSCAFRGKGLSEVDQIGLENGFVMEFSSGFRYEQGLEEKFIGAKCPRLIHNYFPPPEVPFVLNLASLNEEVWTKSVDHARQALRMAKAADSPFYSIHAGFCLDPKTTELGKKIDMSSLVIQKEKHWTVFLKGLRLLVEEAERLGVDLLVENNVTMKPNLPPSGLLPFLCTAPEEAARLLEELPSQHFGMLLDTAHLKVSAQAIGFDPDWFIRTVERRVKAVHHSDNDGTVDNNRPFTKDYWFLKYMPRFQSAVHIIEVLDLSPDQVRDHMALLNAAMQG